MIKKMITTKIKSTWLGTVKTKQCNCTKLISELWHIAMNIKMWHCSHWGQSGRISRGIWIWEDILRSSSGLILERVEEYMEVFVTHWHIFWAYRSTFRRAQYIFWHYSNLMPRAKAPLQHIWCQITQTEYKKGTNKWFFFRHPCTFGQGQSQIRT